MDPPPLKLILVKGPREGETLEFPAGSTIRIGRIVRGNNLPIKDPSISTKHLAIKSEPESGKWTVTDLDSSNGTTINTTMIPAHTPSVLVDGDIIKLGDYTSILVKINGHDESKLRRNPRRRAKPKDVKVEAREDGPEIKETRGRGRGRPRKDEKVESGENMRVTRGRKNEVPENAEVECGGRENNEGKKKRGGGGGRKRKNSKEELNLRGREGGGEEVFREEGGEEDAASRGEVENGGDCGGEERDDKAVEGLDLEKMTLGQFFDYMEVNLRRQIIEETEELIEGMRRKAERVTEYMVEKKKEKGKVPVG